MGLDATVSGKGWAMTETEYSRKLEELDRLLNDPDVPMEPHRVWSLLAEVAQPEHQPPAAAE
jgi:hypothetical protein